MVINSENVSMELRPSRLRREFILDAQMVLPFNTCELNAGYNTASIFLHILFIRVCIIKVSATPPPPPTTPREGNPSFDQYSPRRKKQVV
jgi:hypothetical protein